MPFREYIIGLQVVVQEANFMDSGECFSDAFHNIEPATLAQRELPNGFFVCFVLWDSYSSPRETV